MTITLKNFDVQELVKTIETVSQAAQEATEAATYELAQSVMDELQENIWEDTGALKASAFVSRSGQSEAEGVISGYRAPYAAIVEFTHPRRPYYIQKTFDQFITGEAERVIADALERFIENETTIDEVPARYPEQGTFREKPDRG